MVPCGHKAQSWRGSQVGIVRALFVGWVEALLRRQALAVPVRSPRDSTVVISPHLDDGVMGCGDMLATRGGGTVVTVFAGHPAAGTPAGWWDRLCGFTSATEAVRCRRAEDADALRSLGARPVWLDFTDSQYGGRPRPTVVAAALSAILTSIAPDLVVVPLGLEHVDHRLTRRAALRLVKRLPAARWCVYADAFYRASAQGVDPTLALLARAGLTPAREGLLDPQATPSSTISGKRGALARYHSQQGALLVVNRQVAMSQVLAESYWRLTPAG